jgi:general secretion pathway protein L
MNIFPTFSDWFTRWIDSIAGLAVDLFNSWESPELVRLVEDEDGHLVIQSDGGIHESILIAERWPLAGQIAEMPPPRMAAALSGKRVELCLRPDRFLFRRLELPDRARDLLEGIVHAQIDRLTPWKVTEAVFGWSNPAELTTGRISITIAATARAWIMSHVDAIKGAGAHSIAILTSSSEHSAGSDSIGIWEGQAGSFIEVGKIRRLLVMVLAATGVAAVSALGASALIVSKLDAERHEIVKRTSKARQAAVSHVSGSSTIAAVYRTLERRKQDVPTYFVLLETLSQILPDHTYATELRIEGSTVRVVGVTQNAPSLITAMEQSQHFSRATFFAPTTKSPSDPGERFHLEAQLKPVVTPRP